MRGAPKVDSTVAFLYAHGIRVSPETLDAMVQEAIVRMHRTLYRADPRADLTAAEAIALKKGGFLLEPADLGAEDPLVQTATEFAALLKKSLTTAAAAERLGVDPSRIRQRLTAQPPTLYGIRLESGWVVPEFQFDGSKLIPGMADVASRLDPELHPVSVFRWFTTPNPDLALEQGEESRTLSPREWLCLGLPVQAVLDLASEI
jgi:hypothetical protein